MLLRPKPFAVWAPKGMMMEGAEQNILWEVWKGVWEGQSEDAVMSAMRELGRLKRKTVQSSEWSQENGLWRFHDHIYVPMIPNLQCRIAEQHHNLKIGGHTGHRKTLKLILWNY
jgi:hypothetical protein